MTEGSRMGDGLRVRRIVIADDDPDIQELLVLNLRAEGLVVEATDNGEDAVRLARETTPDLIVLDVMMPQRTGLSALTELKADPATAHIPVVLLTAKSTDAEVWEGWETGADYYITKPFDMDEILNFVRYLST